MDEYIEREKEIMVKEAEEKKERWQPLVSTGLLILTQNCWGQRYAITLVPPVL